MKKRIYIKDWLELKPYKTQTLTDGYYLKICNEIKEKVLDYYKLILSAYFDEDYINLLSCFITSYFEDVISETNIWTSFIELHQELYNKKLPFYDTSEYYEDEINEQDVRFLIWYFFNTAQTDKFINPENQFFSEMATDIMKILDKEYEYAPENNVLKEYYRIEKAEQDYYTARNLIDTILFKTYLFYFDTLLDLADEEIEIIEDTKNKEDIPFFLRENRDTELHKAHTRLLSLTGKEWAAKIIGKNHPLSSDYLNMSRKISGFFFYKGQDDNNVFIEHIASGKKFNLTKKSFDDYNSLTQIDTIMFLGIVKWKDEWWFSGIYFQTDFDNSIVSNEKNSMESKLAVAFLDYQKDEMKETLQSQFDLFKEFNYGKQIAFMPSDKIDEFIKKYMKYVNDSLNLTKKEKKDAAKRLEKNNFKESNTLNYSEVSETGLVFYNQKRGVEIALNLNSAFPLPENKYFKKENSEEHVLRLFVSEDFSTELAMYCIDNCKEKLPFFKSKKWEIILNDINFLLRFWKKNNYYTEPAITFIRQ